jgi:hypothetical protein
MSLRMLTNLRLADLRLITAQQRSTGQNMTSDLYCVPWVLQWTGYQLMAAHVAHLAEVGNMKPTVCPVGCLAPSVSSAHN